MSSRHSRAGITMLTLLASSCAFRSASPPEATSRQLPSLPVQQIGPATESVVTISPAPADPSASFGTGETVTLSAVDVDIRALLPVLAEAAELSLVLGPEVAGRVTVNLIDVPALDAIAAVLEEAELMFAPAPLATPWRPVVFYILPVNIWEAELELIRARYRVSEEMARWIVQSRMGSEVNQANSCRPKSAGMRDCGGVQ